jgi:glycosyltransferase involved in cell wall biosynthesis
MKIAWFTPFAESSAIGRFSCLVAAELARGHDVDIWHPRTSAVQRTALRTVAFSPGTEISLAMLSSYDVPVYNLGDHLPLHRDIWLASQSAPGITVLHDAVMHHFFAQYWLEERNSRVEYVAAMARWYGDDGRAAAEQGFTSDVPLWKSDEVAQFPLFEEALRRAHVVIVHAEFLHRQVEPRFAGPVCKLWLPYDRREPRRTVSRDQLGVPPERVLLVTVGQVNPNKRIAAVLETLGRYPGLRDRVYYAIVGACDAGRREEVAALVRRYGLEGAVAIAGHVPAERLDAWLAHADIFVNLRHPAMEGGSASLAEEMLAGRPVVVSDTGVYSEVPDDSVVRIAPGRELDELGPALFRLVDDAALREALGARARRFAEREFDPSRYAAGFLELAARYLDAKPLLTLSDRMADRLARMGVTPENPIAGRVAAECYSLFCGTERPISR